MADITPIFKKGLKTSKSNYRLVSILPNISKLFEKPYLGKLLIFLKIFYHYTNVVSGKVIVPKTVYFQCLRNGNLPMTMENPLEHF